MIQPAQRTYLGPRRVWVWLPYVLGLAHLGLFNVVFRIERGGFFGGDSWKFLGIADALRSGALWSDPNNVKPLGYPLALALGSVMPGGMVLHALLWNALCFLATIYIVGRIARLTGCSGVVAVTAQIGFALVVNTAAWANLVLSDTMAMALFAGSCWMFVLIARASAETIQWKPLAVLGALLGWLSITRTEYALLLPLVSLWLIGARIVSRTPWRRLMARLALIWMCALPPLLIQPVATGLSGSASFAPPKQIGALQIWASRFDLEFTRMRLTQLVDLIREVSVSPDADMAEVRHRLYELKEINGDDPIDDDTLALAAQDLQRLHDIVRSRGLRDLAACGLLAYETVTGDLRRYLMRYAKRLALFVTAAELEWPSTHAAHRLYTVLLRPLSALAYLWLFMLVVGGRGRRRGDAGLIGPWMAYPILVHSMFVYEQRFAYPSIPLLCVAWGQALQAFQVWRNRHRGESAAHAATVTSVRGGKAAVASGRMPAIGRGVSPANFRSGLSAGER